jgi:hypothetical protein
VRFYDPTDSRPLPGLIELRQLAQQAQQYAETKRQRADRAESELARSLLIFRLFANATANQ